MRSVVVEAEEVEEAEEAAEVEEEEEAAEEEAVEEAVEGEEEAGTPSNGRISC